MRVRITMPTKDGKRLKDQVVANADKVEEDDFGSDEWEVVSTFGSIWLVDDWPWWDDLTDPRQPTLVCTIIWILPRLCSSTLEASGC